MKLTFALFLTFTTSFLSAQERTSKQIIELQSKVEIYTSTGYYKKALTQNNKLCKILAKKSMTEDKVITELQSIKLNYLIGTPFKEWNSDLSKTLEKNITDNNSLFQFTIKNKAIAVYLSYGATKKADSLIRTLNVKYFENTSEIELFEAVHNIALLKIQQGYYNQAIDHLHDHQKKYLTALKEVSTNEKHKQSKRYNQRKDILNRHYAELLNLETLVLLKSGKFSTAKTKNHQNLIWILKNLNKKDLAYVDNQILNAEILLKQENFAEASTAFEQVFHKQIIKVNHGISYKPTHPKYLELIKEAAIANWKQGSNTDAKEVFNYITPKIKRYYPKTSIYRVWIDVLSSKKYIIKGNYEKAVNTLEETIEREHFTEYHPWKLEIYQDLLKCYIELNEYAKSTKIIAAIYTLNQQKNTSGTPSYELELFSSAKYEVLYKNTLTQAARSYKNSISKNIEAGAADYSPTIITLHNDNAFYLLEASKPNESKRLLESTTKTVLKQYGSTHFLYAMQLERLSHYYTQTGKYNLAYKEAALSLEILERYKHQNIRYAKCLRTFAAACIVRGQYKDAENALLKAQALSEGNFNTLDIDEFSRLYIDNGQYSKVEAILLASYERKKQFFGESNKKIIPTLLQLSELYLILGDYPKADDYNDNASQLSETIYGNESLKYAASVKLQGDINAAIGDYEGATKNYQTALLIEQKQLGKKNIIAAETSIKVLLSRHYNGDKSEQIEKLLRRDVQTIEAAFPDKTSPIVAEALTLFAVYQVEIGNYTAADKNLLKADRIWKKNINLKKGNKYSAHIVKLRATLKTYQENYTEALALYQKAANMYKDIFNSMHPEYVHIVSKIGQLHFILGDEKKALKITTQSAELNMKLVTNFFPALSERGKTKFWNTNKSDFEFYNTLAFSSDKNKKKLAGNVYNYKLATKSLLLNSSLKIRNNILSSKDSSLINLYRTYLTKREELVKVLSAAEDKFKNSKETKNQLQKEIDELEEELAEKSQVFEDINQKTAHTWQDVQANLKPNEYALEIIRYRVFDKNFSDSVVYVGLLVNSETTKKQPEVIIIPNGQRLEKEELRYYRNSIKYRVTDNKSYNSFWAPLVQNIPDSATIYVSAEGIYNQINPETFFDGTRYELDKHQIVYVTSTKNIGNSSNGAANDSKALLVANPKFYKVSGDNISQLQGAEKEILSIEKLLNTHKVDYNKLTGTNATEQAIKETEEPRFVHLATHGYFIRNASSNDQFVEIDEAKAIENPLLKSGLLLANAGDVIDNNNYYHYNNEDGILTALETMNMNWSNTEFVVLSACETGLGEVQNGEGVYGLQRTLQLAGVNAIIMSLFKVDDDVTNKLMETFYKHYFTSLDKKGAFIKAKKEIQKIYEAPIYWGAFILID